MIGGAILCQSNNSKDKIVNTGKIVGEVFLGPGNDSFNGNGGTSGKVFGEAGDDTLSGGAGIDTLDGGAGADVLTGRLGRDSLFGGANADRFDFNSIKESAASSNRDVIQDFSRGGGDRIDLSTIDANTTKGGNNGFKFIGAKEFHEKAGELHYVKKSGYVMVEGDRNGDGDADFQIKVKGVSGLDSGDFLL
jgi:Ca2+-binding RTX toxin-like protein